MKIGDEFDLGPDTYTIVKRENDGGFSEVWRADAKPPSKARPLAVKVLLAVFASDEEWKKRNLREARILANISHPNVVHIRSTLQRPDGSVAIIQDFIEGAKDLRQFFRQTTNEKDRLSVVLQAMYGLKAAHSTPDGGTIHRDLSPSNILVDPDGVVRIIDFGLSKTVASTSAVLTLPSPAYGTQGCVAPEAFVDFTKIDHRADLFAFGKTLAASIQDRLPMHAECDLLPEPWRTFCLKLTAHDLNNRYANCDEALDDLLAMCLMDEKLRLLSPSNMKIHLKEMRFRDATELPSNWPEIVEIYIQRSIYEDKEWELYSNLEYINLSTVNHAKFDANTAFELLEEYVFEPLIGGEFTAGFGSTDTIGTVIHRWFPQLNDDNKLVGYRRLVRTAVNYRRFSLMNHVRTIYKEEQHEDMKAQYRAILDVEDPDRGIEGRGIIPGRDP